MRLQSAIFVPEEAFGSETEEEKKVLSLLRMEGVWLYAVTALSREEAEQSLRRLGAEEAFRGILCASETGLSLTDGEIYLRAARRLRSEPEDTVVFAGRTATLRGAKTAGFRTAAVKGAAVAEEWEALRAEADETVERYADFLA